MYIFAQTRYNLFQLGRKESLFHVRVCTPTLPPPTINMRKDWLKLRVCLGSAIRLITEQHITFTPPRHMWWDCRNYNRKHMGKPPM